MQANLIIPIYADIVLSNLEKTLLKCLILEKKFSIKCLSLYTCLSKGIGFILFDLQGITA